MPGVTMDVQAVYAVVLKRSHGVVKRAGRMAVGSARERAPVRKIFTGGRRTKPRFYSLAEAKAELPAFLRSTGRSGNLELQDLVRGSGGRIRTGQMTRAEALDQLQHTPIATSRNRANSWQRTGQVNYRGRAARDDLGNPRKDENGTSLFAAMRDIEYKGGRDRLFDRSAEKRLTTRGRYELKSGRALSIGLGAMTRHSRATDAERIAAANKDVNAPGSEGQVGGNLRRSIELQDRSNGDRPKVSIVAGGDDAPYARFVEFGTRHAAAQPFLRPALKHVEGPFKAMMREAFPGSR